MCRPSPPSRQDGAHLKRERGVPYASGCGIPSSHVATLVNIRDAVHADRLPQCGPEARWCSVCADLLGCIFRESRLAPAQATPLETFWPIVVIAIAIPEIYSVFTFIDPAENQAGAQVRWEASCGRRLYEWRVKKV